MKKVLDRRKDKARKVIPSFFQSCFIRESEDQDLDSKPNLKLINSIQKTSWFHL